MVIDRRRILALMLAGLAAGQARAAAPERRLFVACRLDGAQTATVACFDRHGAEVFAAELPARGHDATLRPDKAEMIVFARRPGNWFAVLDLPAGTPRAVIHAPHGRHFYGHGVYAQDGRLLYATENDIAGGTGVIGIYLVAERFRRIGEFSSGGIGPHDLALTPDGRTLVVANGGLRTQPETGRETLNPDDMKPNLAFIDLAQGLPRAVIELDAGLRRLSIRHLACRADGLVAFGCQHEGETEDLPPLLGTVTDSGKLGMIAVPEEPLARLANYVGSVCFDDSGTLLTATSPRGGSALIWNMARAEVAASLQVPEVCGVAASGRHAFLLSSGQSGLDIVAADGSLSPAGGLGWVWDNHALSFEA